MEKKRIKKKNIMNTIEFQEIKRKNLSERKMGGEVRHEKLDAHCCPPYRRMNKEYL